MAHLTVRSRDGIRLDFAERAEALAPQPSL
jgi:hypothetical protein